MGKYSATISRKRNGAPFTDNKYSRGHVWTFDGGVEVAASSSPHIVPTPMSVAAAVDPEEAFIAALSSCHMLWFLSIAARRGFVVEDYRDEAVGVMEANADGRLAITRVNLRPTVDFVGDKIPSPAEINKLHHDSHEQCFIANSVRTEVTCEPQ